MDEEQMKPGAHLAEGVSGLSEWIRRVFEGQVVKLRHFREGSHEKRAGLGRQPRPAKGEFRELWESRSEPKVLSLSKEKNECTAPSVPRRNTVRRAGRGEFR
jgi:hypothetical protein